MIDGARSNAPRDDLREDRAVRLFQRDRVHIDLRDAGVVLLHRFEQEHGGRQAARLANVLAERLVDAVLHALGGDGDFVPLGERLLRHVRRVLRGEAVGQRHLPQLQDLLGRLEHVRILRLLRVRDERLDVRREITGRGDVVEVGGDDDLRVRRAHPFVRFQCPQLRRGDEQLLAQLAREGRLAPVELVAPKVLSEILHDHAVRLLGGAGDERVVAELVGAPHEIVESLGVAHRDRRQHRGDAVTLAVLRERPHEIALRFQADRAAVSFDEGAFGFSFRHADDELGEFLLAILVDHPILDGRARQDGLVHEERRRILDLRLVEPIANLAHGLLGDVVLFGPSVLQRLRRVCLHLVEVRHDRGRRLRRRVGLLLVVYFAVVMLVRTHMDARLRFRWVDHGRRS